jgi:benzoyl-CoA reductase/2-hydroxyglutaryl-CoA dehydratase subunit BcrC/BadD/HgdB
VDIAKVLQAAKKLGGSVLDDLDIKQVLAELKEIDNTTGKKLVEDVQGKYPEKVNEFLEIFKLMTTDVKGRTYKGNVADHMYEYRQWLAQTYKTLTTLHFMDPGIRAFLTEALKGKDLYMQSYKLTSQARKANDGRGGTPLRMYHEFQDAAGAVTMNDMQQFMLNPSKCVVTTGLGVPNEMYVAMDLTPYSVDSMSPFLRQLDQRGTIRWLDECEKVGVPADTCSYPRAYVGAALGGQFFDNMACSVFSNCACDSAMQGYGMIEQKIKLPKFRVDEPYQFKTEAGKKAIVKQLRDLIVFLEKHTGNKMDWDKLKAACEKSNKWQEMELERWEMQSLDKPPIPGDLLFLVHMHGMAYAGTDAALAIMERQMELTRDMVKRGECGTKNLRYRTIMWNPPTGTYNNFWNWAEQCWGIGILNNMECYGNYEYIDTSSEESMMLTMAYKSMLMPMSQHTRGNLENFFNDMWKAYELNRADFLYIPDHTGCHPVRSLSGLIKDQCAERGVKLLDVRQDLGDVRVVSHQGIRDQVNSFMTNIMNATPLRPELQVFNDDNEW